MHVVLQALCGNSLSIRTKEVLFLPLNRYTSVRCPFGSLCTNQGQRQAGLLGVNIFAKLPGLVYNVTDTD